MRNGFRPSEPGQPGSAILLPAMLALMLSATAGIAATVNGSDLGEAITGTAGSDTLAGGGGDDTLAGDPAAEVGPPAALQRIGLAAAALPPVTDGGNQVQPRLSADGMRLVYARAVEEESGVPVYDLVVRDLATGAEIMISTDIPAALGNAAFDRTVEPFALSPDGTRIAFATNAPLVAGDQNDLTDIYLVSVADPTAFMPLSVHNGAFGNGHSVEPSFSADGQRVAFASGATNLDGGNDNGSQYDIFVVRPGLENPRVLHSFAGVPVGLLSAFRPTFAAAGDRLLFYTASQLLAEDQNNHRDVYVYDFERAELVIASQASGHNAVIGDENSEAASFSPDGTRVVFQSFAKNLSDQDADGSVDIFVRDLNRNVTTLVSAPAGGANGDSLLPSFTPDGSAVIYESAATNIVAGDSNGVTDLFLSELLTGTTVRLSVPTAGGQGNGASRDAVIGTVAGKTVVAYGSVASNLVPGDDNGRSDIFIATLAQASGAADTLSGGAGDDVITGGAGNDLLSGGAGADAIAGGPGLDAASYAAAPAGVAVNLAKGKGSAGEAAGDTLTGIEVLVGSAFADTLTGGPGPDRITGGRGADLLSGGAGGDRFVYGSLADSPAGAPDRIAGFKAAAGDRIDLSRVDANPRKAGRQAFRFIGGAAFSGRRGELRFSGGWLEGDSRGRGKATFRIRLPGVSQLKAGALLLK